MILSELAQDTPLRRRIRDAALAGEAQCDRVLVAAARLPGDSHDRIQARAAELVEGVRNRAGLGDIDGFLSEYRLSTQEGVVLMCLAEALLRIPDADTAQRLIRDKIGSADWGAHLGHSDSAFVNASTWALMLTGRLMRLNRGVTESGLAGAIRRLVAKAGEPMVREALSQAMRILSRQFVMGRTIAEALARSREAEKRGFRHSFDMLGEAARTASDAERYFEAYADAIAAIGAESAGRGPVAGPGISVKLSALHPRFEYAQRDRVLAELAPRLLELCRMACAADIGLTVDAEEAERLEPSLDVVESVFADPALAGWEGFGMAVQAYQKRAWPLIDWLVSLARDRKARMMVRLVKGAYWDTEIKRAQERGLAGYPVFTRKMATDVSYLACARKLLEAGGSVYPQFATHNAHTVAAMLEMAGGREDWEFQRLHGMGEALYAQVAGPDRPCRTYAPVGGHEDLLPYLVRRLLENGANTSFVNRLADEAVPVARVVADPVARLASVHAAANPNIPLPPDLYAPARRNSRGWDLADPLALAELKAMVEAAEGRDYAALPVVAGNEILTGNVLDIRDPSDHRRVVGRAIQATAEDAAHAVRHARAAARDWDCLGAESRAAILDCAANLYEGAAGELILLAIREGGKTVPDAVAEVREAVDSLRYYAAEARAKLAVPLPLPGVTGESNTLGLHGRGVFACISPWNFPLAIFTGQVAAALAAGNAVVAKPAEQTPLIAARAIRLLHEAGVPVDVLHLLPGDGSVGAALVAEPGIAGVAFTGSTETARAIQRVLAAKDGPIVPLIAETGGINAMIVDSSALPEQVVNDVMVSAFQSAGQRCSALRMLFLQADVYDRVVAMLAGAAMALRIGDPGLLSTDVGPAIDRAAVDALEAHCRRLAGSAYPLFECPLPESTRFGTFFAPRAFALDRPEVIQNEVFGPVLHVVRYEAGGLDAVLDAIAATGYGLTLGIHSRIDSFVDRIRRRLPVGNIYVNRSMIGAVVGSQPFGGEGLSGTGPKAGGPHYLYRFVTERTVTVNLAASGGNPALLAMQDGEG
ncbi:MAG: bifunctional proline dehydrogenase/L-glutamate gamma-semialdehyde dehydrogenase PutA [Magnetospirillum sp.]|nr:bifunctional proline dehydrogenase/L-glutamate gamma-semialdehyde dehydrogenase PutA [Magnetospirillum sp.]